MGQANVFSLELRGTVSRYYLFLVLIVFLFILFFL